MQKVSWWKQRAQKKCLYSTLFNIMEVKNYINNMICIMFTSLYWRWEKNKSAGHDCYSRTFTYVDNTDLFWQENIWGWLNSSKLTACRSQNKWNLYCYIFQCWYTNVTWNLCHPKGLQEINKHVYCHLQPLFLSSNNKKARKWKWFIMP